MLRKLSYTPCSFHQALLPEEGEVPFVSKDNMCGCGLLSPGLASTLVICVMCPCYVSCSKKKAKAAKLPKRNTKCSSSLPPGCNQIFIS